MISGILQQLLSFLRLWFNSAFKCKFDNRSWKLWVANKGAKLPRQCFHSSTWSIKTLQTTQAFVFNKGSQKFLKILQIGAPKWSHCAVSDSNFTGSYTRRVSQWICALDIICLRAINQVVPYHNFPVNSQSKELPVDGPPGQSMFPRFYFAGLQKGGCSPTRKRGAKGVS